MNQRRLRNLKKQVCCGGIKSHCLGLFSELKMTFWIAVRGVEEECVRCWRLYMKIAGTELRGLEVKR